MVHTCGYIFLSLIYTLILKQYVEDEWWNVYPTFTYELGKCLSFTFTLIWPDNFAKLLHPYPAWNFFEAYIPLPGLYTCWKFESCLILPTFCNEYTNTTLVSRYHTPNSSCLQLLLRNYVWMHHLLSKSVNSILELVTTICPKMPLCIMD
jgi:hypothetical protein